MSLKSIAENRAIPIRGERTVEVDAVASALERLLSSQQFANSRRSSRFLRCIVEATLSGRGESLKEFMLGVEVFDRATSFDPRIDTIVRVEAVKLRKRLQEYYAGPGRQDSVAIELPKGRYVPRFRLRDGRAPEERAESQTSSIAVLPFANLSADPENQYFSDGLADEILNGLARVRGLRTVARTSAFAFRGKEQDVREIGQALNVGAILEGSLRRAGKRIRVAVQLISARDGYHLWSETYDRAMTDIFGIQQEIAQAVVRALRVKLTVQPEGALIPSGTENLDAYQAYLEGRYYAQQLTEAGMARCRACHKRAIALDPNYAYAYAGLAEYYFLQAVNARPQEVLPLALAAVERALELDPSCAEAYSVRGALRATFEYNWSAAGEDSTRALELNPASASAHCNRASWYLNPLGRLDEALAEVRLALGLDPLWAWPQIMEASLLYFLGRKAEAIQRARDVMALFPAYWFGYYLAATVMGGSGFHAEGATAVEKALKIDSGNPFLLASRAENQARVGEPGEARRSLQQLEQTARTTYVSPVALYIASAACGEFDQSYDWLHKGVEEHDIMMVNLDKRLMIPGYQDDPRYHALLGKMNLAPSAVMAEPRNS